jgi:hypothetical protein
MIGSKNHTVLLPFPLPPLTLRFVSSPRFPVNSNLLLRFQTRIMDNLITLNGNIVWRRAFTQGDIYYQSEQKT